MHAPEPESGAEQDAAERMRLWLFRRARDLRLERAIQSGQLIDEDEFGLRPPRAESVQPPLRLTPEMMIAPLGAFKTSRKAGSAPEYTFRARARSIGKPVSRKLSGAKNSSEAV